MVRDDILVAQSQAGDIEAFEELVSRNERRVFNLAYRMIGNHEDAVDLAQEVFIKAFQAIKTFRGEASFSTWIGRIAINICRDELRRRHRRPTDSLDEKVILHDGEVSKQYASPDPGPEEIYEKTELQQKIQQYINDLTPEFRTALVMRDIGGYSYEEIAEATQSNIGTVKSRISRARNYLKDKLLSEKEQIGLSGRQ